MMQRSTGKAHGLAVGVAVALAAAILIRFIPESWLLESIPRAALFLVVTLAAPPSVFLCTWVARRIDQPRQLVLDWAVIGALTFDGVMMGFWPSIYGQTGRALSATAAVLLFAFATLVLAGQLMNRPYEQVDTARPD